MSQLKILIKGIALCHFDESIKNWRVFVPEIQDDHIFRVSVIKIETGVSDQVLFSDTVPIGSKIVLSNDSLPPISEFVPILLEDSFDLYDFHKEPIPLVDEIEKYAAFVELRGIPSLRSLISFSSPLRFFNLKKVREDGSVTYEGESACRDDIFTMAQPLNTSRTTITLNGTEITAMPHSPQISYEVVFDNDCHRDHNPTADSGDPDFKYYYNIIDKTQLIDKCHFELEPIPVKCEVAGCGTGLASEIKPGNILTDHLSQ